MAAVVFLAACSETTAGPSDSTRVLDLSPRPDLVVVMTVHFTSSASRVEMSELARELNSVFDGQTFADMPTSLDPRYDDRLVIIGWSSLAAGQRGEDLVRRRLAGSPLVERIEVVR